MDDDSKKRLNSMIIGAVLICAGILFLISEFFRPFDFFPVVLVLIGVGFIPKGLIDKRGPAGFVLPVLFIGLGILMFFDFFWPGILLVIGLMILLGAFDAKSRAPAKGE